MERIKQAIEKARAEREAAEKAAAEQAAAEAEPVAEQADQTHSQRVED